MKLSQYFLIMLLSCAFVKQSLAQSFKTQFPLSDYYTSLFELTNTYPLEAKSFSKFIRQEFKNTIKSKYIFTEDAFEEVENEFQFLTTDEQNSYLKKYVKANPEIFPEGMKQFENKLAGRSILAYQVKSILKTEREAAPEANEPRPAYSGQRSMLARDYVNISYLLRVEKKEYLSSLQKVKEKVLTLKRYVDRDIRQGGGFAAETLSSIHSVAYYMDELYHYVGKNRVPTDAHRFISNITDQRAFFTDLSTESSFYPKTRELFFDHFEEIINNIALLNRLLVRNPEYVQFLGHAEELQRLTSQLVESVGSILIKSIDPENIGPKSYSRKWSGQFGGYLEYNYFIDNQISISARENLQRLASTLDSLYKLNRKIEKQIEKNQFELLKEFLVDVDHRVFNYKDNLNAFRNYGLLPKINEVEKAQKKKTVAKKDENPFKNDWNYNIPPRNPCDGALGG